MRLENGVSAHISLFFPILRPEQRPSRGRIMNSESRQPHQVRYSGRTGLVPHHGRYSNRIFLAPLAVPVLDPDDDFRGQTRSSLDCPGGRRAEV